MSGPIYEHGAQGLEGTADGTPGEDDAYLLGKAPKNEQNSGKGNEIHPSTQCLPSSSERFDAIIALEQRRHG